MDAQKVVFTSAMVTLGSTASYSMLPKNYGGRGELPSPKLLIGTSLSFLGLSILADFAPELAGPLAATLSLTALTYYGLPLLNNYFGKDTP